MKTNHNPEAYNYARLICQRVTEEMIWVRRQMNLSRCETARRGGLHRECICGVERGDNLPTLFLTCRSCHGLAVRSCDLITAAETGDRSIYQPYGWYRA